MNTPEGSAGFFSTDKTPEERAREVPKALSGAQHGAFTSSSNSLASSISSSSTIAMGSAAGRMPAPMTFEQKGD
jgi:hypothetical protein